MLDPIKEWAVWAIMLLPLGSFALISFASFLGLTRSGAWSPRLSGYVTILAILGSFLLSLWAFDTVIDSDGARVGFSPHEWLTIGPLEFDIGVTLDGLSGAMLIVVTSVSLLVQFYSQEYMRGDDGYNRYYAYMSLFTASMLGLVIASSVLQLFVFWELVGLCSYLLIGFWFYKDSARRAATKAFLVTRVGDLGFMIAILIIYTELGTFEIVDINEAAVAGVLGSTTLFWMCMGLFSGAAGKSAQFPLHVWLPDAMEGPTPVSALIHAATMVAAGVYLVARFFPSFAASNDALTVVAAIGSITAIIAALLGVVATDIKRVMAYSTISQLGYMMMGLGVAGLVAAVFHLVAHAFFKALLFLGSGSVNHATGTFDMREMGGLRKHMPITFGTMLIGSLALVGLFPLSGFWSKDEILADAWQDKPWVFVVALTGVFLTGLYVGRMLIMTFGGDYRGSAPTEGDQTHTGEVYPPVGGRGADGHDGEPHESPWVMTLPLVVLAIITVFGGLLVVDEWFGNVAEGWLSEEAADLATHTDFALWIAVLSSVIGLAGMGVAWVTYEVRALDAGKVRAFLQPLPEILDNRYYLDALYQDFLVKGVILNGTSRALSLFDKHVIDGVVNGVAWATAKAGDGLRLGQAGQAQLYASVMFAGSVAAVIGILVVTQS